MNPWHSRTSELADWTLCRLVNRSDCWGEYRPLEDIGKEYTSRDGTKHKLGAITTRWGQLSPARICRHYRATGRRDILGLHAASAENLCKWGALDIDAHGEVSAAQVEANWRAALHWYDELVRLEFCPLLISSNGKGGFHLRVLLAEPIDAARVYHFLRRLTADYRRVGLDARPEQFPKQPDVCRCEQGVGNWLRLPGKHHSRAYWSEVWDGSRWLAGHDAIDLMLSLAGDNPALVPPCPPPAPPRQRTYRTYSSDNLSARIAAYLSRLPNLSEGQGRDDVAFHFAAWMVRDLSLDDSIALAWLERWDAGNSPPKGRERLAEILQNAKAYGQRPQGCGLTPKRPEYDRHGHRILRVTGEVF
jgi:hypothetical protein